MAEHEPVSAGNADPELAREMAAIPYEPLLPIEKKLIAWSLIIGIVLLVVLVWLSFTYFPVTT